MNNELYENLTVGNRYKCFLNLLDAFNISKIRVSFSGGGDSGGIDDVEFSYNDDKCNLTVEDHIKNEFYNFLEEPVYDNYGGFAGEYNVNGDLIYDVRNHTVFMTCNEYSYEYDDEGNEIDENGFEQTSVIYDESKNYADEHMYDFLSSYVILTKDQLNDTIKNKILLESISGNDSAREFIIDTKDIIHLKS